MNFKKLLSLVLSLSLLLSCLNTDQDECAAVSCLGFVVLGFEVIQNDENVFDIGTYSLDDVTIDDTNAQTSIELLSSIGDTPALLIQDIDWSSAGNYNYTVSLGDNDFFTLSTTFELSQASECCGSVPILTAIEINGESINLTGFSGIFTVNL